MEHTIDEKDFMENITLTVHIKKMFASDVRFWIAGNLLRFAAFVVGIGNIDIHMDRGR